VNLPPVLRALDVPQNPEQAFALFTGSIGAWWPLPSHGLFGPASAEVAFEDGLIVERATDGRSAVWGEVLAWEPPGRLLFSWHPGDASGAAGQVEVRFLPSADGDGTRIELSHSGWQAFGERAAVVRRDYGGRQAWGTVLDHLADLAERQSAAAGADAGGWQWPGVDRAELEAAYDTFWTEAGAGGFGAPVPGGWTAHQVMAHVAVNDGVLAAAVQGLIHERSPRLENLVAVDPAVLDAWVARHDADPARLVTAGRARARRLVDLIGRLDTQHLEAAVPTRLQHDGEVVLDADLPWARVIATQLTGHLPGHTEQLRALRP
jgi:uncharacterized protein YndB with AHSA1/START domain